MTEEEFQAIIDKAEQALPKHDAQFQQSAAAPATGGAAAKAPKPVAQSVAMNESISGIVPDSAVLIKGRQIRDVPMPIREAVEVQGQRVVVMGDVFAMESREVRGERTVMTFQITDGTYSVLMKLFDSTENLSKLPLGGHQKGQHPPGAGTHRLRLIRPGGRAETGLHCHGQAEAEDGQRTGKACGAALPYQYVSDGCCHALCRSWWSVPTNGGIRRLPSPTTVSHRHFRMR